jgi:hypothetical protein
VSEDSCNSHLAVSERVQLFLQTLGQKPTRSQHAVSVRGRSVSTGDGYGSLTGAHPDLAGSSASAATGMSQPLVAAGADQHQRAWPKRKRVRWASVAAAQGAENGLRAHHSGAFGLKVSLRSSLPPPCHPRSCRHHTGKDISGRSDLSTQMRLATLACLPSRVPSAPAGHCLL